MTTILATFVVALVLSLILTPLSSWLGTKSGAMDMPNERKIHTQPIPRTGGLAIFVVFLLTLVVSSFFNTHISDLLVMDRQLAFLLAGAIIAFGVGLFDDFRRLDPKIKFLFQVIAATAAYWGGIRIIGFNILGFHFHVGFLSYVVTLFWFVLFINAVNLVDGLDGLAGGIVVFASLVMVILAVLREEFLTALLFTALGGSVLGFLRYNFNPATVFLGDGGSYFLGYCIAGLSILGSVKSQIGAAMLIPLIALGVPLFDTILSPLRRFIRGRAMFRPDNGHVHHRLIGMGLTTTRVVWLIYAITAGLCLIAVAMVNIRDERAGLFLIVLGAGVILFTRKLGYFDYFASDKIFGWFKDISDEAGFSRGRRSFLSLQIDIGRSRNLEEMWENIANAVELLEFDSGTFYRYIRPEDENMANPDQFDSREAPSDWHWARSPSNREDHADTRNLLRLELPLLGKDQINFGTLVLLKDLQANPLNDFALRRVEHLRRTIIGTMGKFEEQLTPEQD
ncbi:glycosyltransferase family 4 protein [Thermodesulfobacteriota bacterium]